jgi:hypothetical protein
MRKDRGRRKKDKNCPSALTSEANPSSFILLLLSFFLPP